jgi:hypothetical protein
MRQLNEQEIESVAGGFEGTRIPFTGGFLPGENVRLSRPTGAIGVALVGLDLGWEIGTAINNFNQRQFGMSTGVALYRTVNGGSNISAGSGTSLTPVTRIEEI